MRKDVTRNKSEAKVADIMHRGAKVVSPSTKITEAARLMREGDFGAIPVCEDDRLVGMITDRDICCRAVAEEMDLSEATVSEAMTDQVLTCYEDDDISQLEQLMSDRQIRRVPVLNSEKRLVGIVSLANLARSAEDEAEEILEEVSQPTHREPQSYQQSNLH